MKTHAPTKMISEAVRYELRGAYGEHAIVLGSFATLWEAGRAYHELSWHETGGAPADARARIVDTAYDGLDVTDEAIADYDAADELRATEREGGAR